MEAEHSPSPIKRTIQQMLANLASPQQIKLIEEGLLQLPLEEEAPTIEIGVQGERQAESLPYNSSEQPPQQLPPQIQKEPPPLPAEQVASVPYQASVPVNQEVQLPQDPIPPSQREQPLTEPPLIAGVRRNATEQSSERSRTNLQSSRKGQRRSSEEESVNLQLTQKTKRSKNMSFTQNKVDSLLYSDATLLYSNDTTGFDREASLKQHHLPLRTQSHNVALKQVEDEGEISARMERAQSRQCERMPTESQKASEREQRLQTQEEGNVFQTQIDDYKGKISKIRQLKENKKRKLQLELRRVNQQLEDLTKREMEVVSPPKPNNFQSRVKINDNAQAKAKAERLVGRLHQDKRSRQQMHLGELQAIDKNINDYMQQLMKERYKNEERIKQKKKLEIIDRMRQQEMRKMEEQQKKDKNLQFIHQLRNSNSKPDLQPQQQQRRSSDHPVPHHQPPPPPDPFKNKQRSHTKKSQPAEQTPELSRKKAYLKKVRNISFKKEKPDAYEQLLN